MSDVNAQLAHWEDLGEESRRLEASMTDTAELVQRLRDWKHVDGNSIEAEELVRAAADALGTQAKRIAELEVTMMRFDEYKTGSAKAIEMAADTAEEWFFSEEAGDLDALIDAIKALKLQLSVPRP